MLYNPQWICKTLVMGEPLYLELEIPRERTPDKREFVVEEQRPKFEIDYTVTKVGVEIDIS